MTIPSPWAFPEWRSVGRGVSVSYRFNRNVGSSQPEEICAQRIWGVSENEHMAMDDEKGIIGIVMVLPD
jgi:hypothetical protein